MLGTMPDIAQGLHGGAAELSALAGGFALWASVSEARSTRAGSSRDLLLLALAAAAGAVSYIALAPLLRALGSTGPELCLAVGAFCVGYLRRFGVTGAGVGSQIYIGQLLADTAGLGPADLRTVAAAGLLAALAAIVPRLLSGPAERPAVQAAGFAASGFPRPELVMGLQAAAAAALIVGLNAAFGLPESVWAITACTYVIASSASGTVSRVQRRIVGTAIGVPLGLACLPLVTAAPLLGWGAAAAAMVVYAMALPERYGIACGAYAFTLIMTLAVSGEHSVAVLAARAWETVLGGVAGLLAAKFLFPIRSVE